MQSIHIIIPHAFLCFPLPQWSEHLCLFSLPKKWTFVSPLPLPKKLTYRWTFVSPPKEMNLWTFVSSPPPKEMNLWTLCLPPRNQMNIWVSLFLKKWISTLKLNYPNPKEKRILVLFTHPPHFLSSHLSFLVDLLGMSLVKKLFSSTLVFLSSRKREVVRSTLVLVRVTIGVLPSQDLQPQMEPLVSRVFFWFFVLLLLNDSCLTRGLCSNHWTVIMWRCMTHYLYVIE